VSVGADGVTIGLTVSGPPDVLAGLLEVINAALAE
jgi:hypothetical protein